MKRHAIIPVFLCFLILLTACTKTNRANNGEPYSDEYSSAEMPEYEVEKPREIDDNATVTGDFAVETNVLDGYVVNGSTIVISKGGEYTLSGSLSGNVEVTAEGEEVDLILDNVEITSESKAPISFLTNDKSRLKIADNSHNIINDNRPSRGESSAEEVTSANAPGTIYSKQTIKISGSGILTVKASYHNGIHSKDKVKIESSLIKISSENCAIKGNDGIEISSGEFTLTSGGDSLKTEKGDIEIKGGIISAEALGDCVDSGVNVLVGGDANLTLVSKGAKTYNSDVSTKGIKAGNQISINGGKISINTQDDAVHANTSELESGETGTGIIEINGGEITISTKDDGIHAEGSLTINDGNIAIKTSYEGLESKEININGGNVFIYATDDGINAADGSGGLGGFGGRGGFGGSTTTCKLVINGGYVDVTTGTGDTDGIDCNGSFYQTGGFLIVKGGSSSGNVSGSIDVDGEIVVTGGTTVALGGICETPVNSQNAYVLSGSTFSTGKYTVKNESNSIISFELTQNYRSCWICSDLLKTGEKFTLLCGDNELYSWTQTEGTMGGTGGQQGGPGGWQGGPGGQQGGPGEQFNPGGRNPGQRRPF